MKNEMKTDGMSVLEVSTSFLRDERLNNGSHPGIASIVRNGWLEPKDDFNKLMILFLLFTSNDWFIRCSSRSISRERIRERVRGEETQRTWGRGWGRGKWWWFYLLILIRDGKTTKNSDGVESS